MPQQQHKSKPFKEAAIQLALQAVKQDATLTLRRAAAIYNAPYNTLRNRYAGRTARANCTPKSRNMDQTKEDDVVVKHILELVTRGFPPRLAAVADMANSLRAERNIGQVGSNWPSTFVKGRPELTIKFNCKYNYKRALCKDPKIIQG
ncbi:uncharacterized protein M421DRAFT_411397 [Didymella exigua CBS 183.55]|uniref:HTH psq-type domain-containing protein n=1 Tax=Didymella exigua CBS 183.55 TaxID=1150837 RepID=A0A6A5R306_9PLEO|nr:uncharacterized protein M421DRAFT_411397 [Didymella exigua CBS 183.55]KAF1922431.1 hypothetical protein M421DRAFT_411397 [Didymella exigua CBS 183.55]